MKFNWSSIKEYSAVVDVRTPAEYALDHIPGAVNMPVLDNQERAQIGKLYRIDSFTARKQGMGLVAARMSKMIDGPLRTKDASWRPLIYCARGGLRSASLVEAMRKVGWEAEALPGGYKAYRRFVLDTLANVPQSLVWHVLCGPTGVGKTLMLRELKTLGAQVLDLEQAANHRGSLFGGQGRQSSQRSFEATLARTLLDFDPQQQVFVEAESMRIGNLYVPRLLLSSMHQGKVIILEAPLEARATYIAAEYPGLVDPHKFGAIVGKLAKFVGRAQVAQWLDLHHEHKYQQLAVSLLEMHYDRKYAWALNRHYDLSDPLLKLSLRRIDVTTIKEAAQQVANCSA